MSFENSNIGKERDLHALRHTVIPHLLFARPTLIFIWILIPISLLAVSSLTAFSISLMVLYQANDVSVSIINGLGVSVPGASMPMMEPVVLLAGILCIRIVINRSMAIPIFLAGPKRTRVFFTITGYATGMCYLDVCLGSFISELFSRAVMQQIIGMQTLPVPLQRSLLSSLIVALILSTHMIMLMAFCVILDGIGKGIGIYAVVYYILPIIVSNIQALHPFHRFLPSIVSSEMLEINTNNNSFIGFILCIAYAAVASVAAVHAIENRDMK